MTDDVADHPLYSQPCVGKQAAFHASHADSRWIVAGNQSGKTTAGAREVAWFATGTHPARDDIPVPSIGWVITLDRTFVEEVLLPAVLYWIPKQYIRKIQRGDSIQVHLTNGSRIVFRTYGQGWMKFQGAKIHYAWFDEECPSLVYDETMVRLLAYKGPHWVTMTPLQGKTWVYQRIISKRHEFSTDQLEIFSWKTTENTSLDADRVETVFGRMPAEIRAARMSGDFVDLEGLVWKQFDERVHLVNEFKLQPHWPVVVGMDYGYRHPFAAVFLAVDDAGRTIVWKTYRRAERLLAQHARSILEVFLEYAPHLVDQSVARRVLTAISEGRVPNEKVPAVRARFVIDASAQQCKRELIPYGISADNSERDVIGRIERVGELLLDTYEGRPGMVIMRGRNGDLVDEMRGYSWKKSRAQSEDKAKPSEPQDVNDDACDALGYGVMELPSKAPAMMTRPPEGSPEWLRRIRAQVKRVKARMGNERVPEALVHSRMLRMGRAW